MKLLHVVATPRSQDSNTLKIANHFIDQLKKRSPNLVVETLDLFNEDLPAMAGLNIEAKYTLYSRLEWSEIQRKSWSLVEKRIAQFLMADLHVVSAPLWNLSIPYVLKYYIDTIVQPNYMFRYNEQGVPEGMVHGKKMVCVSTRGGDYSPGGYAHHLDFQEPYLRAIFGFIGIKDMTFINAQPMDITPELREIKIAEALKEAETLAASIEIEVPAVVAESTPTVPIVTTDLPATAPLTLDPAHITQETEVVTVSAETEAPAAESVPATT